MKIAAFHTLSGVVSFFLLGIIAFLAMTPYIETIMQFINSLSGLADNDGYGRHLLDYSVGFGGTSRLLQYGNYYNGDYSFPDVDMSVFDGKFIATFTLIFILWALILELVNSIFVGAYFHAIADIYAGCTPFPSKSIYFGRGKVRPVFGFRFLRAVVVGILFSVAILIPVAVNYPDFENTWTIALGGLLFNCALFYLFVPAIAVVPAIVVERKPIGAAVERSWKLCRTSLCFIFCSLVAFGILKFIFSTVTSLILHILPGILEMVGKLFIGLLLESLSYIFIFVIYISLRIQTENTTQEDIAYDIGNSDVVLANGVELSTNKKDGKGSYGEIVQAEVV
jgi:hypothetical protein